MAVLRPLKVVIENLPEGEVIELDAPYNPEAPEGARRKVPLTRELYIEQDDFAEVPPKKWQRLAPGVEVRLRYACLITCREVIKDASGKVVELRCVWDPNSRGGMPADGRKVKGRSIGCRRPAAYPPRFASMIGSFRSRTRSPIKTSIFSLI